ncbi:MAG: DUF1315 family protein [Porticoccaceae bacterium]|jgi:uncharacterized protein YeaC (DUF1315 family)|nr:DUF1315 family protein [Porticoccaceae bacterium]HLS99415.1 DUF1315 family protein [Porticoccaceae bacterium]
MDYQQLLKTLTPDIYENLKRAVELGKWPNGEPLTPEQRETCLQAVIAWDAMHKPEQERVGYIHTEKHDHCGEGGDQDHDEPRPIKWS